eukprot:1715791-Pyramimonas_sp.AAC.1
MISGRIRPRRRRQVAIPFLLSGDDGGHQSSIVALPRPSSVLQDRPVRGPRPLRQGRPFEEEQTISQNRFGNPRGGFPGSAPGP